MKQSDYKVYFNYGVMQTVRAFNFFDASVFATSEMIGLGLCHEIVKIINTDSGDKLEGKTLKLI